MPLRVKGEWNIVVKRKRSEKNFVFEKKNSSISVVHVTKRRMKSKQKSRKQNKGAHTQHFSRVFFFILRYFLSSDFYYRTIDFIILHTHIRKNRLNNNELNFNYTNGVENGREREDWEKQTNEWIASNKKGRNQNPFLFFHYDGFNVYFYFGYNFYCKRGKMIHHHCIWWFEPFVCLPADLTKWFSYSFPFEFVLMFISISKHTQNKWLLSLAEAGKNMGRKKDLSSISCVPEIEHRKYKRAQRTHRWGECAYVRFNKPIGALMLFYRSRFLSFSSSISLNKRSEWWYRTEITFACYLFPLLEIVISSNSI